MANHFIAEICSRIVMYNVVLTDVNSFCNGKQFETRINGCNRNAKQTAGWKYAITFGHTREQTYIARSQVLQHSETYCKAYVAGVRFNSAEVIAV